MYRYTMEPGKAREMTSKKLLKQHPSEDEKIDFLFELHNAPDHALAITAAAYLDHAIELLLRSRLRGDLSPDDDKRLFNSAANGILGMASAKIRVAYAMRAFEKLVYEDLLLVNGIRNVFAHSLHKITFKHEDILRDCKKLNILNSRKDMYPDRDNINARDVYYNTILDLYMGVQLNIRGIGSI